METRRKTDTEPTVRKFQRFGKHVARRQLAVLKSMARDAAGELRDALAENGQARAEVERLRRSGCPNEVAEKAAEVLGLTERFVEARRIEATALAQRVTEARAVWETWKDATDDPTAAGENGGRAAACYAPA